MKITTSLNSSKVNFTKGDLLQYLEDEAIHIIRMAYSQAQNPVLLYSTGKDSTVLLHLTHKAFYPGKIPFPMLHVDTTFKFNEMYSFRDRMAQKYNIDCIVKINSRKHLTPWGAGSFEYTNVMKTQALLDIIKQKQFDILYGGARREEEKIRAKERVFSFRDKWGKWDAKAQRIEMWDCFNGEKHRGENIRVFPLSNWTEKDVWEYIKRENLEVVSLYFAKERPCIVRDNMILVREDNRMPLLPGETVRPMKVRFRTLGCYPLTAAIKSDADTIDKIIDELRHTEYSERCTRLIDNDSPEKNISSMEWKKENGYF